MASLVTPMALRVAVTLGLPDRLRGAGAGAAVGDMAAELGRSPVGLELLLAHLATLGIVERTATGYRTTDFGAHLCVPAATDTDNGLARLLHLDSASGRADLAFVELAHSVSTGQAAYARRYGQDFWSDLAEHPHLRKSFDEQMTWRFRDRIPEFVSGVDWARFGTLVDVGGGNGALLAAILAAHPAMRGQLVDLAPTAAEAARTFTSHGLGERAEAVAGSFFEPLPAGADAYLLFDILHNWDDEHAHQVLARCAEAMRPTSRVLVIESVGGRYATSEFDLVMLVCFGGRDRRLEEFRTLAGAHGLVLDTVRELVPEQRSLLEFRLTTPGG
jgi:hypothetical protein